MSQIEKVKKIERILIADERGWFLKVITGIEEHIPPHTGEIYLTMGKQGQSKGGHYHHEALEWFTLIQGTATLKLEDIVTHERLDIDLSFENPTTVFIPNGVAHELENNGDKSFILLAYTDKTYTPEDTIQYKIK